jgi:hypothetical protein
MITPRLPDLPQVSSSKVPEERRNEPRKLRIIPLGLRISQRESISRDNSRARSHPQLSRKMYVIHHISTLKERFLTPELVVRVAAELVVTAGVLSEPEVEEATTDRRLGRMNM